MIKKLIFILSHDLMFVIQFIMYVLKTLKSSHGNYYLKNNIISTVEWPDFWIYAFSFMYFWEFKLKKKWCKNEEIFC